MTENSELIKAGNQILYKEDLYNKLRQLGVKNGDVICVHSQIFSLGKPMLDKDVFLKTIIDVFKELIGDDGILIMPTFSYSFCSDKLYDVLLSESTVGVLTEYFRNMSDVSRTEHPIFSFAIWGKRKNEYMDIGPDAFGLDSVYGKMIRNGGKMIMFGANKGYTFYYLAEERVNVSHRYFKNFRGQIKKLNGLIRTINIPYYVRDLKIKSDMDEEKVSDFLLSEGLQKQIDFGKGSIGVFECRPTYEKLVEALIEDERRFL